MSKKTKHSGYSVRLNRTCEIHTTIEFVALREAGKIDKDERGYFIVPKKVVEVEAEVTTLHLRNHEMRIVWTNPFTKDIVTDNISADKFFEKYQINC